MKPILHPRDAIELFQSQFLAQLDKVIPPTSYSVKGGCNLRMLLGSPRASEDLDLDIQQVAKHTLQKRVEAIEKHLKKTLCGKNINLKAFTAPKQTDTVQRWKAELELLGQQVATKIEFSRRGISDRTKRSPLRQDFQTAYQVEGVNLSHYGPNTALKQKIKALAGRKVSQARDVFDAAFLMGIGATAPIDMDEPTIKDAETNTHSIRFQDYTGQVIPYLEDADAEKFNDEAVWNGLRQTIINLLHSITPGRNTTGQKPPEGPK